MASLIAIPYELIRTDEHLAQVRSLRLMVSAQPIDAPSVTLPAKLPQVDVLLLPREISEGRGLYDDSVDMLAKEIRASGATAQYQHDVSSRGWIGEKHLPVIVLDVIAGVLSNALLAILIAACASIAATKSYPPIASVPPWFACRQVQWPHVRLLSNPVGP